MKQIGKRFAGLALAAMIFWCFGGCGARTTLTEESFQAAMKDLSCTELELSEEQRTQVVGANIKNVHFFSTANGGRADFYEYAGSSAARSAYAQAVSSISAQGTKVKVVDSDVYNFARYENGGNTYVAIRNDNLFVAIGDVTEMAEEILGALGY